MTPDTNGWSKSEMYVLAELQRLSRKLDCVDEKVTRLRVDVAKTGALWGALSAVVISAVGALFR